MNVKLGFNIYTALIVLLLVVASKAAENYYSSNRDFLPITGFQAASSVPSNCDKYFGDAYCDDTQEYCGANYKSFSYTACKECQQQRADPKTGQVKYGSDKCAKYGTAGAAATVPEPATTAPTPASTLPATFTLKGDFNNNGCVEQGDFRWLLRFVRGSASYKSTYSQEERAKLDLNSDGKVDNADVLAFSQFNGNGCIEAIQQIKNQQQGSAIQMPPVTITPAPSGHPSPSPAVSTTQPLGSCQNSCGAKSKTGTCYCDDYSVTNKGDYCADIATQCPTVWNNPKNKFK